MAKKNNNEIIIERTVNFPIDFVWEMRTNPEHIPMWWAAKAFETRVNKQELKKGGKWEYVIIDSDGIEYPSFGVFSQIVEKKKIVATEVFGENFKKTTNMELPKDIFRTTTFEDKKGKTKITISINYPTEKEKERLEMMDIDTVWDLTLDRFEEHLEEMSM